MTALPSSVAELLSASEKNKAIEDTNKSLLDSLVSTVESLITEDNANTSTSDSKKDNTTTKVTDPVYVRFESNGGSSVEKQKIQKDTVAKEPSDPTKDGYTFYGWYVDKEFNGEEFDFENTKITETTTLYANGKNILRLAPSFPRKRKRTITIPTKRMSNFQTSSSLPSTKHNCLTTPKRTAFSQPNSSKQTLWTTSSSIAAKLLFPSSKTTSTKVFPRWKTTSKTISTKRVLKSATTTISMLNINRCSLQDLNA